MGQQHEDYFSQGFAEVIQAYIAEQRLAAELSSLKGQRHWIASMGTVAPTEQIEEQRKRAHAELDAAEAAVFAERCRSSSHWKSFFEDMRNSTMPLDDKNFRKRETEGLVEIAALRRLVDAAAAFQLERIKKGELEPGVISEREKTMNLARFDQQIADVQRQLGEAVAVLAPLREGHHDYCKDLIERYAGSQAKAGNNPVRPESMNRTSKAYGDVTRADHPDAAQVFMAADDPRRAAWEALRDFLAAKRAA